MSLLFVLFIALIKGLYKELPMKFVVSAFFAYLIFVVAILYAR